MNLFNKIKSDSRSFSARSFLSIYLLQKKKPAVSFVAFRYPLS